MEEDEERLREGGRELTNHHRYICNVALHDLD